MVVVESKVMRIQYIWSTCGHCRALSDAECSLRILPNWPKGHFRRGKALYGLQVGLNDCVATPNCTE